MKADRVIWGVVCASAIVVGAVFAVVVPSAPAHAQYVGDGVYGAGGSKFGGGTLTSGITFSGVATDIATAGSEDLTIAPGGSIVLKSGDNIIDIQKSDGTVEGHIGTNTGTGFVDLASDNATGGIIQAQTNGTFAGRFGNIGIGTSVMCINDGMSDSSSGTTLWCLDGVGIEIMKTGVTANNNLAGTSACAASGDVGKRVLYSDTGSSKITECICEQTGAATFAWGAATAAGDCT